VDGEISARTLTSTRPNLRVRPIVAFATSEIIFIKEVGAGTALAILIDATIIRALLVPSLMALLGPWNWWAPKPLRRLHGRLRLR
jgi:RND superfamily putative drug exporter